ncbi:unnamed protein product [Brassicogethes aeneus]|uniref:Regulatory protein zeste n=1 Tax=Brassicogethes aeneus TaxID=1431903 RepID=A0A9P0BBY9_BRAAE|nr:unnamed protein product [Brassicogethes aeneus]
MCNTEPPKKKARSTTFSSSEEMELINIIGKYAYVIECKQSGKIKWTDKKSVWEKIGKEFNCTSGETFRSVETLKAKYKNLKKDTKKKCADNKMEITKTGGGFADIKILTPVEVKVTELLGGAAVEGLNNNFDSDAVIIEEVEQREEAYGKADVEEYILAAEEVEGSIGTEKNQPSSSQNVLQLSQPNAAMQETEPNDDNNMQLKWSSYSPAMLKSKMHKKLGNSKKAMGTTQPLTGRKPVRLNEQLIQEKIGFVKLQKENCLQEHALKMKVLRLDYKIKKNQLQMLQKQTVRLRRRPKRV